MLDLARGAIPESIAIICQNGKSINYKEFQDIEDKISEQFANREVFILLCGNDIETIVTYAAAIKNGSIPILLDRSVGSTIIDRIVRTYKPRSIWCTSQSEESQGWETVFMDMKRKSLSKQEYPIHDELALLLTTSGSTGSPKMVRISYKNIRANTESICQYLNITKESRHITTLPMAYTYGLSCINTHLWRGGTIIANENSVIETKFWETIEKSKPTTMAGVPYTYELLAKIGMDKISDTSIQIFTQAGGKLASDTWKEVTRALKGTGKEFWVMYGQTEATARMSYLPESEFEKREGSIGLPIPGGEFIVEENHKTVGGELIYKGENVSMGYATTVDDLSLGDINQGVLKTGDVARVDEEGYWYIVGRNSRFVKLMGKRINLKDIEDLLRNKGWACACKERKEQLIIFHEGTKEIETIRKKEIKNFIRSEFGISPTLFKVKVIEKFPRNSSGKISYDKL